MDKALLKAQEIFSSQQARKDARKVLVIITDGSTGANKEAIKIVAKVLIADGVKVVPVALGPVPERELSIEIPGEVVIKTNLTDSSEDIADKIMEKVTSG